MKKTYGGRIKETTWTIENIVTSEVLAVIRRCESFENPGSYVILKW
jgi:hypothetical protein